MIESFKFENFAKLSLINYKLVSISIHHNIICMWYCFKFEVFNKKIDEVNEIYDNSIFYLLFKTSNSFFILQLHVSRTNFRYYFFLVSSSSSAFKWCKNCWNSIVAHVIALRCNIVYIKFNELCEKFWLLDIVSLTSLSRISKRMQSNIICIAFFYCTHQGDFCNIQ